MHRGTRRRHWSWLCCEHATRVHVDFRTRILYACVRQHQVWHCQLTVAVSTNPILSPRPRLFDDEFATSRSSIDLKLDLTTDDPNNSRSSRWNQSLYAWSKVMRSHNSLRLAHVARKLSAAVDRSARTPSSVTRNYSRHSDLNHHSQCDSSLGSSKYESIADDA